MEEERTLFDDLDLMLLSLTPPHESGSVLGATGGAAPLTSANSPNTANAGLPWRNRRREWVRYGRIERIPGAE